MSDSPFGMALVRARRRAGLAQATLSDRAGVSTRHLSFLETGRSQPSRAMVDRLAAALGLDGASTCALKAAAGFSSDRIAVLSNAASVSMPLHDQRVRAAFETAVALQDAACLDAATELAARAFGELGIHQFATGTLRMSVAGAQIRFDPAGKPAVGWMTHCVRQGYRDEDPFVRRTASGWAPFLWADVIEQGLSLAGRRIVEEARAFGIGGGFVLPLRRLDGSVRALTSWAERTDSLDPALRPAARLVGSALLDVAERLVAEEPPPHSTPRLGQQSRSILCWLAAGRDVPWIARRTAADDADVLRAISEACVEMGAADPWQAISRATALDLISP